jgi:flavin-dependent dehydrogenase
MSQTYDVIVVGARCAGASTALLLGRRGYRVLLVDRSSFPSDTISTHVIHPKPAAALSRWGVLDRLVATECPAIETYAYDFGRFTITGTPRVPGMPPSYCPRRTVLDKLLVDEAIEAGVELREGFRVDRLITERGRVVGIGGRTRTETANLDRAEIVIGADGRYSTVAALVGAEHYHDKSPLMSPYYAYWSGLPMAGRFETYVRPHRGFAAAETHDGLTMVVVALPYAEFDTYRRDIERHYLAAIESVPTFAARLREAKRETPFAGLPTPNYFRQPYGPGWMLIGDAGYLKDPITAQGIADAFRDAEACAAAVDDVLAGSGALDTVMCEFRRQRDESALPMYDLTCQLATLVPPAAEMQRLLAETSRSQSAMDAFVRMNAGTISPAEFFAGAAAASGVH